MLGSRGPRTPRPRSPATGAFLVPLPLFRQNYMEQVPGVDRYFMSRCYNAADS